MSRQDLKLRGISGERKSRIPTVGMIVSAPDGNEFVIDEVLGARAFATEVSPAVEGGVWMTNHPPSSARKIRALSPGAIVLPDGWAGVSWEALLEEWGFAKAASAESAGHLFRVFGRVVSTALQVAVGAQGQGIDDHDPALDLLSRSSLAAGLNQFMPESAGQSRALNATVAEMARDLHLCGIRNPRHSGHASETEMTLRTFRPRIAYVRNLSGRAVPEGTRWYRIDGERLHGPLSSKLVIELAKLNRPIVVKGVFQRSAMSAPSWLRHWFAGPQKIYGRTCLTLEEAEHVLPYGKFLVQEAYAGTGWRDPEVDHGLCNLLAGLFSVCGGVKVATMSWSSGVAAENFLRCQLHHPFGKDSPRLPENAWIAAHDRIAMIPAIEAIDAAGGRLVSAHAGSVEFRITKDREAISSLAVALWRQGFLFPMGQAHDLRNFGVTIPLDARTFSGSWAENTLAVAIHGCRRGPLWHLDSSMDLPLRKRSRRADVLAKAVHATPR